MKLDKLPLTLFLALPFTLIVTFSIAVKLKHVKYLVPYISDSGALPPESCIFGQVLNILSILMGIVFYVRYKQLEELIEWHNYNKKLCKINFISLYVAYLACIGISLVANFQEVTMLAVHWAGALLAFGLGSSYQCFQVYLTHKITRVEVGKFIILFRLVLSVLSSTAFTIFAVSGITSTRYFHGDSLLDWRRNDGGYDLHLTSTICEWICASCTTTFLLTFTKDFKTVEVNFLKVSIQNNVCVDIKNTRSVRTH